MAWIRTITPEEEPQGLLGRIYADATRRAGKVWNILRLMSVGPRQLQASMSLYQASMFGESGLTRAEREMVATVVSRANDCFY